MSEEPLRYDPRHWHNIQPPEFMDISRRFEYDEDHLQLLRKWLRLDDGIGTIVEVGCGSGFFTEKLCRMSSRSRLICVEPDEVLRRHAERKLGSRAAFLKGTAEEIPLPSDFSDLTVCHIMLNNLPDVLRAVGEMTRITKPGGMVASIEPFSRGVSYTPDPVLQEMNEKTGRAFGMGVWGLRSELMDYPEAPKHRQARYPEVFHSCGLRDVEAHGLLSVFLLSDARRDRGEVKRWLEDRLKFYVGDRERSQVIMARGGLDEGTIAEAQELNERHLRRLVENPDIIPETHELESVGRIVTIGFKPDLRSA